MATLSPDGNWQWDGQQWVPVKRPPSGPPTSTVGPHLITRRQAAGSAAAITAEVTLATVDRRSTTLTHLVGDTRAYLQQIDLAHAELTELRDEHLAPLLEALAQAQALVREVNSRGTAALRASSPAAG